MQQIGLLHHGDAQVAVEIERHRDGLVGPSDGGDQVTPSTPLAAWIEQLFVEGITAGCGANPPRYCPDHPVTRGEMAVFLDRAFGLPL